MPQLVHKMLTRRMDGSGGTSLSRLLRSSQGKTPRQCMPPPAVCASRRAPLKPAGKLVDSSLVELVRTVRLEVPDLLFEQRLPQVLVVDDLSVPVGVETELAGSDISGKGIGKMGFIMYARCCPENTQGFIHKSL